MAIHEEIPNEETLPTTDDLEAAMRVAESSGAQVALELLQSHPYAGHLLNVALRLGARQASGAEATGATTELADTQPGLAHSENVHAGPTTTTQFPGVIRPPQPDNPRRPGIAPAYTGETDAPGSEYDAEPGYVAPRRVEPGRDGSHGSVARRPRPIPAGPGGRPLSRAEQQERLARIVGSGRTGSGEFRTEDERRRHPHRRGRIATAVGMTAAMAAGAAIAVSAARGSSPETVAAGAPEAIQAAVPNPTWLPSPNVLTGALALHKKLIQAAADPDIAVMVKPNGNGSEAPYNAVKDNPAMLRAVATVILVLGGDPYGFRHTQLEGVVPQGRKEYTDDLLQINKNRETRHEDPLSGDAYQPENSLSVALLQANRVAARTTKGDSSRPLPADFYSTYFTTYCEGIGYQGRALEATVARLNAILASWEAPKSNAYTELLANKEFVTHTETAEADQRQYIPAP